MSVLWLRETQVKKIVEHSMAETPNEACGLLLGDSRRVTDIIPTANKAANPSTQYEIDPVVVSRYLNQIIGFYHSHPDGKPIPSKNDIESAWHDDAIYVIVGLKDERYQLTSWKFGRNGVEAVEIHIGDDPPAQVLALSQPHRAVIILSGTVALMLFVLVALSLLPPAPPIP